MACTVVHKVLSSHVVVFPDGVGMWHTALWCFPISTSIFTQYTNSHARTLIFSIPICLLCSFCSICLYNFKKELSFFYLSWQCHQSLPIHFLLDSTISCYAPFLLSCVASPVLGMPSALAVMYPFLLLPMFSVDIQTGLFMMLMPHMFILIIVM